MFKIDQFAAETDQLTISWFYCFAGIALGRDGGAIKQMFMPFFFGLGGRLGSGKQWFPWIHVDDVAGIITHAIETDGVSGVLNAVAPQCPTNGEFTAAFAKAMWRPALFPVPAFSLKWLYGPERATALLEGQKVIPKRTLESNYEYLYPDLASACEEVSRIVALDVWCYMTVIGNQTCPGNSLRIAWA